MVKIYFNIDNCQFIHRYSAVIFNQKIAILSSHLMSLVLVYLHLEVALGKRHTGFLIKRLPNIRHPQ